MRRSKAPSALRRGKRPCPSGTSDSCSNNTHISNAEDEPMKWGSKENPAAAEKEKLTSRRRVFRIVWRDVSNKKHKTWKGDGTLETTGDGMKAVIKDDTGKYLGSTTKFLMSELQEDYQLTVGSKEIEIQSEIKDEEELFELRKTQMKNRNWGEEEYMTPEMLAEEKRKPKGAFVFKPILILKAPHMGTSIESSSCKNEEAQEYRPISPDCSTSKCSNNLKNPKTRSDIKTTFAKSIQTKKLMCFFKPSELQEYLLHEILEYSINNGHTSGVQTSSSLVSLITQIGNHPSFVKHEESNKALVQHLTTLLPHWSEMGPFDSSKLEFVQYFLQNLIEQSHSSCIIIIADNINALNMLQGLCDFMNLNCFRLQSQELTHNINDFLNDKDIELKVILTNSICNLHNNLHSMDKSTIIVYESVWKNMEELNRLTQSNFAIIYYLITSFGVEESRLASGLEMSSISQLELLDIKENVQDNIRIIADSAGINDECFNGWEHFAAPIDVELLQKFDLENISENITYICCKED